MDISDCIKFATENPTCAIATVEGDKPKVRYVRMCFADETGFYFQTESPKAIHSQIQNNANIEVAFVTPDPFKSPGSHSEGTTMMRLSGKAKYIDDLKIRQKILEARPFLQEQYGIKKPEDPLLSVFAICSGEAYFWTGKYAMRESEIPRIRF